MENLMKCLEANRELARFWTNTAGNDIVAMKDNTTCIYSLCLACEYAAKVRLCLAMLRKDYGMQDYDAEAEDRRLFLDLEAVKCRVAENFVAGKS